MRTGRRPFCSCPEVGSRLTSQISPRFIIDEFAADGLAVEPFSLLLAAPGFRIALGEKLIQGIAAPLPRLNDQTAAFNRDADLGARLQAQDIEQRRAGRRA